MAGSSGLRSDHPTQHSFKHEKLSRIPRAGSSGHGIGSSDKRLKVSGLEAGSSGLGSDHPTQDRGEQLGRPDHPA
jgi:hypothetical protein